MSTVAPIHSVHFYDTQNALVGRLCGIVSSGLETGDAVLVIITPEHRLQLQKALRQNGVDVELSIGEERLVFCDAAEMLSTFMVGGHPDPALFLASMGQLLVRSKRTAFHQEKGLVVFGEMVAVLWDEGNQVGALALERLWNALLNERAFHLHCAYPRELFSQDETGMINICESHSHVVGGLAQPN